MITMTKSRLVIAAIALAVLGGATANPASATTATFASFTQANAGNGFTFTNSGTSSGLSAVSLPINFTIYDINPSYNAIAGTYAATLTLTSTVSATDATFSGYQFQDLSPFQMTITAKAPILGLTNLLTVNGSNPSGDSTITGQTNAVAATINADTGDGDSVAYSSAFFDFSAATDLNFALSLTSLSSALSKNGNGYLNSFTASGSGNFASDPAPVVTAAPEPDSAFAFMIGLAGLGGLLIVGRKQRDSTATA
jgi:hypothetical protein